MDYNYSDFQDKNRFKKINWTKNELLFIQKYLESLPYLSLDFLDFKTVNDYLIRSSIFGCFLDFWNKQQGQDKILNENKLGVLDFNINHFKAHDLQEWKNQNDFINDIYGSLKKAVKENDVIDMDCFYTKVSILRIVNKSITFIDDSLRLYKNLTILILSGNEIREIFGKNLPRGLKFIELFSNKIRSLQDFCTKAPKTLIHIGLNRNRINDASHCHLLAKTQFKNLMTLDLAENDICDLLGLLQPLQTLQLVSLKLQGNPCSVTEYYKNTITKFLPTLIYLDNTEIVDKIVNNKIQVEDAGIIFTCHKIVGLPPLPKEKNVIHSFYFEVHLPLLSEEPLDDTKITESSTRVQEKPSGLKKGKPKGKSGVYYSNLRHEPEKSHTSIFKSERFDWLKLIQLPEEALIARSPTGNLFDLRDTFRTSVNVKLIYLKINDSKNIKSKKDKKSKSSKTSGSLKNPDEENETTKPEEIILQRSVLANFWCDLHSINWSDKTIDFFWSESCKDPKKGNEVEGNLRALTTVTESSKSIKSKTKSKKTEESSSLKSGGTENSLTFHIGFGLKRL